MYRTMGPILLLLTTFGSVAASQPIGETTVSVTLDSGASLPDRADRLTLVAESLTAEIAPRDVDLQADTAAAIQLPPGLWRLTLESDRFWTPPFTLDAVAGSAPVLPLYPLGRALVSVDSKADEPIERLVVDFDETAYRGQDDLGLQGRLDCAPLGDRWACPVPVGTFDITLRARQRVPQFFWERLVLAHPAIDLGQVVLPLGASLTGEVRRADGEPLPKVVRARLERTGRRAEPTTVSPWGFFQFTGLDAGDYRLTVEADGFADAIVDHVRIQPNTEAGLQRPMTLHRPIELRFRLTPTTDLVGEPWRLDLLDGAPLPSKVGHGRTNAAGLWATPELAPGAYRLLVSSADGARVAAHDVEVDAATDVIDIEIDSVWVEGRVTLGDEPLDATLSWGGRHGQVSVSMVTDEEGRYTGLLPRDGGWALDIESSDPKIFRRLGGVEVDPLGGSVARVDIDLPDTSLEIDVVDSAGEPVPTAGVFLVRWSPPVERPSAERVDDDGRLVWRGLAPGTYRVEALDHSTGTPRRSDAVEAVLDEDAPDTSVRLELRDTVELAGRLVTAYGSPIPGAMVKARPAAGSPPSLQIQNAQSGADGTFHLALTAGVQRAELTILAPGFVFEVTEVDVVPGQVGTVVLVPADAGGTLRLHTMPLADDGTIRRQARLLQGDRVVDLAMLRNWALAQGQSMNSEPLVLPAMPPGSYALCPPGDSTTCFEDVLLPGLTIELGESPPPPSVPTDESSTNEG